MSTIQITCGKKTFTISEDNLKKSDYFTSVLLRWCQSPQVEKEDEQNEQNTITVDQDPRVFRHFLNALRAPVYDIPNKYKTNVYALLDFYGVKYTKLVPQQHDQLVFQVKTNTFRFIQRYTQKDSSSPKYVTESSLRLRKHSFQGKLIDIYVKASDLKSINIRYNKMCILSSTEHVGSQGFPEFFKTYLNGLVGKFSIEIEYDSDNIGFTYDRPHEDYTRRMLESVCKIVYFELVQ